MTLTLLLEGSVLRFLGCFHRDSDLHDNIYCFSFFYLQRPESVKIDARDINGTRFSVSLSALPARVFQHEFDHLQVILQQNIHDFCTRTKELVPRILLNNCVALLGP